MAFPQVASVTITIFGSNTTSHDVDMPAAVDAGDLLLTIFGNSGSDTVTEPADVDGTLASDANGTAVRCGVYYEIADGDEDGGTIDFVTSGSKQACAHVYHITGHDGAAVPAISTATTSFDATPDPGPVTAATAGLDNLFIACFARDWINIFSGSTYPTNYTDGSTSGSSTGSGGVVIGSARRELTADSDDPGSFDPWPAVHFNEENVSYTICVQPTGGGGGATNPKGPFGMPLHGPFGGPLNV